MRKVLMTLGIVAALTTSFTLNAGGGGIIADRAVSSTIQATQLTVEPVLNFDVTGSTLSGPIHSRITVNNNGLITASQCGSFGSNSAGTAMASPTHVAQLRKDLIDAGAMTLPDQSIPLTNRANRTTPIRTADRPSPNAAS